MRFITLPVDVFRRTFDAHGPLFFAMARRSLHDIRRPDPDPIVTALVALRASAAVSDEMRGLLARDLGVLEVLHLITP